MHVHESLTYIHACVHHIYIHTHKAKAKVRAKAKSLSCHRGHAPGKPSACALSRHYVPVRSNLLEPGQGARRSTAVHDSQCTLLPSTRPGTRLQMGGLVGLEVLFTEISLLPWDPGIEPVSLGYVMSPRFLRQTTRVPTPTRSLVGNTYTLQFHTIIYSCTTIADSLRFSFTFSFNCCITFSTLSVSVSVAGRHSLATDTPTKPDPEPSSRIFLKRQRKHCRVQVISFLLTCSPES